VSTIPASSIFSKRLLGKNTQGKRECLDAL
jgi:hypothetical protein